MPIPSDPLDSLFERSRPAVPPLAHSVRPEVWRRIRTTPATGRPTAWWVRLENVFAQPSFAVAFVTGCMLFGLFLAEMRLSRQQAERNTQLAASYVQLIAPLLEDPPLPRRRTAFQR